MDCNAVNTGINTTRIDTSYFSYPETKTYVSYVVVEAVVLTTEPGGCFVQTLYTTGRETSLKQVFSRNPEYWQTAFPGRPIQDAHSLAVYRKSLESIEGYSGKQLHILLLKYEGCKSSRNPNALPLEQFCGTQFFGTLVVSLSLIGSPYSLCTFRQSDMQILTNINRLRGNTKPAAMVLPSSPAPDQVQPQSVPQPLQSVVPTVHPVLEENFYEMASDTFFMYRYKTLYCPRMSIKHDWNTCLYAHWIYDYRRPPDRYYYIAEMCPLVAPDRGGVCKDGAKCVYSHSPLEKLYHPSRYKVFPCESLRKNTQCVRKCFCAFYHSPKEQRNPDTLKLASPSEECFLPYAEPRMDTVELISNYVETMQNYKDVSERERRFCQKLIQISRRVRGEDRPGADDNRNPEEINADSMERPKDYFALFNHEEKLHCGPMKAVENEGIPAGKIFIDGQYIDNGEEMDAVEEIENDSKMTLICESICSSGSSKNPKRISFSK